MNMYGSCRLLSHGSTTNNIEIVNGNKLIVKPSKQFETRKEYCPSFDHTKEIIESLSASKGGKL